MTNILVEKLPADNSLYKLAYKQTVLPGQWISTKSQQLAIFQYSNNELFFVAPNDYHLPNDFQIKGEPIQLVDEPSKILLLADNNGEAMLFHLINTLRNQWGEKKLQGRIYQILMGTESAFPFTPVPSRFLMSNIPTGTIASSQLLEDLALPARLASTNELPGCFPGSLSELLNEMTFNVFLEHELTIVAIGSKTLLTTIKKLLGNKVSKQFLLEFNT